MTFETGLDEIGLEMKRAANSRLRGDVELDLCVLKLSQQNELLREAYEHLSNPDIEPWMDARANIITKIKTALGDV